MNKMFIVTKKAKRSSKDNCCFYCSKEVGQFHDQKCVLVKKKVKIRAIIEYDVQVPSNWGKVEVEYHRNEGAWRANNLVDELQALVTNKDKCHLCSITKFEYVEDTSEAYLDE